MTHANPNLWTALSQQGRYTEAVEAVEQSIEAMTRSFLNTAMYVHSLFSRPNNPRTHTFSIYLAIPSLFSS